MVQITSAGNLELSMLRVEHGLEPCQKWSSVE